MSTAGSTSSPGATLTLNYVAQYDDGRGGIVSTRITVSIHGATSS